MAATTSNVYFACMDCKAYVDAGYRWATWQLEEPGLVRRGQPISVESLLTAGNYWEPAQRESSSWLYREVLPSARTFLLEHKSHRIVFGNTSDFLASGGDDILNWMEVGFLPVLLPRFFVEQLGLKTWDQVSSFVSRQDSAPWWWMLEWDDLHSKAKRKFQELVESKRAVPGGLSCKRASH
jgi:hypothetical protein